MTKRETSEDFDSRIKHIRELYDESSAKITHDSQYVGYGVLIALFSFGKDDFFISHSALATVTSFLAIFSLVFIYISMIHKFISCKNILERKRCSRSYWIWVSKNEKKIFYYFLHFSEFSLSFNSFFYHIFVILFWSF